MASHHFNFEATGTVWSVDIDQDLSGEDILEIEKRIKSRVLLFEQTYSRFREDSLLAKISKTQGEMLLPEDAQAMFDVYFKLYSLTDGLFTPLMGQTLEDAGYDKNYSLVAKEKSEENFELENYLEYKFPTLIVKKPVKMDFGACGKGYIIDIVGEILVGMGINNFCVDAGGDILYKSTENKELRVGLEDPEKKDQVIGVCNLVSGAICGSSGNRRKWGKFNHIINPKTFSSPNEIVAVWVCASSTMIADALATCLFFVEPHVLSEFSFEYVVLYQDYSVKRSPNFPATFFGA